LPRAWARNWCSSVADANPFLERFYRNPRAGASRRSCTFCSSARSSSRGLQQQDLFAPLRIADYLIDKDRLFARVTLEDEEYRLYEQVYTQAGDRCTQARSGDLSAGAGGCAARAHQPARHPLRAVHRPRYLERLNDAYARFFHEYEAAPLLIVNAAAIDPVNSEADFAELLAAVRRMRRGRLYYNPLRHAAL
jgi:deoxyguanosine kinase